LPPEGEEQPVAPFWAVGVGEGADVIGCEDVSEKKVGDSLLFNSDLNFIKNKF
jgi:hypothetical protein